MSSKTVINIENLVKYLVVVGDKELDNTTERITEALLNAVKRAESMVSDTEASDTGASKVHTEAINNSSEDDPHCNLKGVPRGTSSRL